MRRAVATRVAELLTVLLLFAPYLSQSATPPQGSEPDPFGRYTPHGYVNDFAGIIDPSAQAKLDAICKDLDQKRKTQMAIATVTSLDGIPIKEFGTRLANRWGVGYKDNNRGILILLSQNDRQYRLSVGYGLESVLTDEESAHLAREMVPMLQKGDYGGALLHLAERIHDEILQKVK